MSKESIIKSFHSCGITNSINGSQDELISCFKVLFLALTFKKFCAKHIISFTIGQNKQKVLHKVYLKFVEITKNSYHFYLTCYKNYFEK